MKASIRQLHSQWVRILTTRPGYVSVFVRDSAGAFVVCFAAAFVRASAAASAVVFAVEDSVAVVSVAEDSAAVDSAAIAAVKPLVSELSTFGSPAEELCPSQHDVVRGIFFMARHVGRNCLHIIYNTLYHKLAIRNR